MNIGALFFRNPFGGMVTFTDTITEISSFIREEPKQFYKIIIGSDTSASKLEPCEVSIITAIIVWRVGKGGIYFLTESSRKIFHTRRDRIIHETMSSLTLAQEIRSALNDTLGHEFLWDGNEIHADIGMNGESRDFVREVTGLIKGYDFIPVIKPEAWGASSVADKHT